MRAEVKRWGGSLAICIPEDMADEAGLDFGQAVDMQLVDGELRIRKRRRKHYDLEEMLASVPDDFEPEEWDTGPPVGNEVWW